MGNVRVYVDTDDFMDEIDTRDLVNELECRNKLPKEWDSSNVKVNLTEMLNISPCSDVNDICEKIREVLKFNQ